MERGERKGVLVCVTISMLCITILFSFLLISLWDYKLWVGISLLVILLIGTFSLSIVIVRGNTSHQIVQIKQERSTPYDIHSYP
jgi:hypothetical protein